jgi:hypothetical protein
MPLSSYCAFYLMSDYLLSNYLLSKLFIRALYMDSLSGFSLCADLMR